MKTLKEIKSEIEKSEKEAKDLTVAAFDGDTAKMERYENKQAKLREFLRTCARYIETEPREDFVIAEQCRLIEKKKLIEDGFADWLKNQAIDHSKEPKEYKPQYYTQMNMKDINLQLKTLNYLLS